MSGQNRGVPGRFPPAEIAEVKALACELPAETGRALSRRSAAELAREAVARGIVCQVSGTTVWRWLAEDAIRPWAWRSWASGSHSVTFADVAVPHSALRGGFVAGDADAYMERNLLAGLFHASASLGIAESAASAATDAASRRDDPDARTRMLIAENVIELGACRATLSRSATLVDDSEPHVVALFAETQAAKAFVNEASARIVDRALAIAGGAGYLNGHPLARAYRDVRAGSFMHPLGANRAYELLGDVARGRPHALR